MSTGVIDMAIATLGVIQMVIAYQLGKHTKKFFLVFSFLCNFFPNVREAKTIFLL